MATVAHQHLKLVVVPIFYVDGTNINTIFTNHGRRCFQPFNRVRLSIGEHQQHLFDCLLVPRCFEDLLNIRKARWQIGTSSRKRRAD